MLQEKLEIFLKIAQEPRTEDVILFGQVLKMFLKLESTFPMLQSSCSFTTLLDWYLIDSCTNWRLQRFTACWRLLSCMLVLSMVFPEWGQFNRKGRENLCLGNCISQYSQCSFANSLCISQQPCWKHSTDCQFVGDTPQRAFDLFIDVSQVFLGICEIKLSQYHWRFLRCKNPRLFMMVDPRPLEPKG